MNFCLENEMSKDLLPPVILLRKQESMSLLLSWIPAYAEILMVQFILHWQFLLKPEIEFKIIEPGDRWFYPL
jgi:hypothetical protein